MVRPSPRLRPPAVKRSRAQTADRVARIPLADASCEMANGRTTVVFLRGLPRPPLTVWTLLTEPEQLSTWAPFTADRALSRIGRATLSMLDAGSTIELRSVVFQADSPTVLEYSWGEDTLTWTLDAAIDGTRLTLRQTLADHAMASATAAGWHLCLDVAASIMEGHPTPPIRGMAAMDHGWPELNRRYADKLGVEATRVG